MDPYGFSSNTRILMQFQSGPSDFQGAPPAYSRFDHASESSSTLSGKPPPSSSTKAHPSNPDVGIATAGASSTDGRSSSKPVTKYAGQHYHQYSPARVMPGHQTHDTVTGETLSEKAPQRQATQTPPQSLSRQHQHQQYQYANAPRRGRSSSVSLARSPHYPPPTSSRVDSAGPCGYFQDLPPRVRIWLSFGAWVATSAGFLIAVACWKTEVFTALDNLSLWLVAEGYTGYAYMFSLIVLTTVPPFPLYSTLMMLAGYTWGTWPGFVLSYTASLFGAIVVYFISRYFFGKSLVSLLKHMPSFARTVRAVSRNPKLLFLVRFAPYPYNVMNVVLAASPSLRWRTYIGCTALSLLKVVIHTSIGSGIRSFKGYHGVGEGQGIDGETTDAERQSSYLAKWSTIVGVVLCFLLLIYLGHIARKAVDVELEDDDMCESSALSQSLLPVHNPRSRLADDGMVPRSPFSPSRHSREPSTADERQAFLSPVAGDSDEEDGVEMSESRLSGSSSLIGSRPFRR